MVVKGYVDRMAGRERVRLQMLAKFGEDYMPPGGWEDFFGPDDPVRDMKCQQCGEMVAEVRPFGKNHESICEECAKKDMETTELRWRGLNPNG
jgi:hypothetical protein